MPGSVSRYRISPLAEADLEEIWFYTFEHWSLEQADRYHNDMVAVFEGLAAGTKAGRRIGIREGYLKYAVGAHFVFYRQSDFGIVIIRILHQKMDAGRHL